MSRTIIGLVLGGALMMIAAACGSQPTSDSNPANVESPGAESPKTGNAEAPVPATDDKPVVTVNLSPT